MPYILSWESWHHWPGHHRTCPVEHHLAVVDVVPGAGTPAPFPLRFVFISRVLRYPVLHCLRTLCRRHRLGDWCLHLCVKLRSVRRAGVWAAGLRSVGTRFLFGQVYHQVHAQLSSATAQFPYHLRNKTKIALLDVHTLWRLEVDLSVHIGFLQWYTERNQVSDIYFTANCLSLEFRGYII